MRHDALFGRRVGADKLRHSAGALEANDRYPAQRRVDRHVRQGIKARAEEKEIRHRIGRFQVGNRLDDSDRSFKSRARDLVGEVTGIV